jgi:hypothetical protein
MAWDEPPPESSSSGWDEPPPEFSDNTDLGRIKNSFADPATRAGLQKIAFTQHPINWAESHVGDVLPAAGQMIGGIGGGALGGAAGVETGPGALATGYAGAVAGAGAGQGAGEAAREWLGQQLGVNKKGLSADEIAKEAKLGAIGEAIGKPVMGAIGYLGRNAYDSTIQPAIKQGGKALGQVLRDAGIMTATDLPAKANAAKNVLGAQADKILGDATEAGATVDPDTMTGPLRTMQAQEREIGSQAAQKASAAAKDKADFIDNWVKGTPETPATPDTTQPWQRGPITGETPLYRGKHPELGKGDWTLDPNEALTHAGPGGKVQVSKLSNIPESDLIGGYEGAFPDGATKPIVPIMKGVPRDTFPASEVPNGETVIPGKPPTPGIPGKPYTPVQAMQVKTRAGWDQPANGMATLDQRVANAEANGAKAAAEESVGKTLGQKAQADLVKANAGRGAIIGSQTGQATAAENYQKLVRGLTSLRGTDAVAAGAGSGGGTMIGHPVLGAIAGLLAKKGFDAARVAQMPLGYLADKFASSPVLSQGAITGGTSAWKNLANKQPVAGVGK